ncbi:hypothetical protein THAOC_32279 [Thalassiosira oceanica]|uniref:NFACT RNA-binding domain-containing protein n=1 Tax=Thalassiosira oceanica TaxID=159749 RepID=K0R7H9_THAOC|nr:hypothetical protein THAOC_32279 [Thalassiosira oceanica]|eukprot:EJK48885.1 hypothetical protein THAOC_32279 [Thalassiosira oceanica]
MVYYFTSRCGAYTIYMGKDKHENETLIKYGLPEGECLLIAGWIHPSCIWGTSDKKPTLLIMRFVCLLIAHQRSDVWFHVDDLSSAHVYLRLKPGQTLDDIPEEALIDCCSLCKANSIQGCKKSTVYIVFTRWKNLKKTSGMVDGQVGYHRPNNVRRRQTEKNNPVVRQLEKTKKELFPDLAQEQAARMREIQEERSYERIMTQDKMTSNADMNATVDDSAAVDYEDDFIFGVGIELAIARDASDQEHVRLRLSPVYGRPTDRGAAEEPNTDFGPEGGVDGPQWTCGATET